MEMEPLEASLLGQFPQLKTYNHGILLFKQEHSHARSSIEDALETSIQHIATKIPWLRGQVVQQNANRQSSGVFRIVPWSDGRERKLLRVRNCSDIIPSYDTIMSARGPAPMFPGDYLCPVPGFPQRYDEAQTGPASPILVQLSWIDGGAILDFANQHNAVDGTGLFQFINLLATVLSGDEIPATALKHATWDPATIVMPYTDDESTVDHSHFLASSLPTLAPTASKPSSWAYFKFRKTDLPTVKQMATSKEVFESYGVPFISSNDAVSAFFWQRLSIIRARAGVDLKIRCKFSRAIDSRAALGITDEFMGQLVYMSPTFLSYEQLLHSSLPTITAHMRKDLNTSNTKHAIRSYATFISQYDDKMKIAYGGPFNREHDVASSSMAQASLVKPFGALGMPSMIRRPTLAPLPGTFYIYPTEADGNLNILVCLPDEEIEALRKDQEWSMFTEYIG